MVADSAKAAIVIATGIMSFLILVSILLPTLVAVATSLASRTAIPAAGRLLTCQNLNASGRHPREDPGHTDIGPDGIGVGSR
jgi:hypothetical protein